MVASEAEERLDRAAAQAAMSAFSRDACEGPAALYERRSANDLLAELVAKLRERERIAVVGHLVSEETLVTIAKVLGVGRERARQIKANALNKLVHPSQRDRVDAYRDLVRAPYAARGAYHIFEDRVFVLSGTLRVHVDLFVKSTGPVQRMKLACPVCTVPANHKPPKADIAYKPVGTRVGQGSLRAQTTCPTCECEWFILNGSIRLLRDPQEAMNNPAYRNPYKELGGELTRVPPLVARC